MERTFEQLINQVEASINLPESKQEQDDQLQQTKQWREQRRGLVTGSRTSDLMSCDHSAAKKEWGRPEKTIALGKAALKYIYEKCMERKYGKVVDQGDIIQFKYGRAAEAVVSQMLYEKWKKQVTFIEQPFLTVKGYEAYIGASPDGLGLTDNGKTGIEIKAAMSWGTLYDRVEIEFDQSHKDFWQVQTEVLALEVPKLYYVTAHPPENVFDFLNATDMEEQKKMIGEIEVIEVQASPVHQKELLKRAVLAREIGDKYLNGMGFNDAVREAVTNFDIEKFENTGK